jgi:hypothetical protein
VPCQRTVERDIAELEADDLVERCECFGDEFVEHPRVDPLVASSPQRRVRHREPEDRFDVNPRRAGHQPDQDTPETQLVRHPRAVTPERMTVIRRREQRLDRRPHSIDHFRLERAHDDSDLHLVDRGWVTTPIIQGPHRRPVDGQLTVRLPARVLRPRLVEARRQHPCELLLVDLARLQEREF